jgi:hypothetical protein
MGTPRFTGVAGQDNAIKDCHEKVSKKGRVRTGSLMMSAGGDGTSSGISPDSTGIRFAYTAVSCFDVLSFESLFSQAARVMATRTIGSSVYMKDIVEFRRIKNSDLGSICLHIILTRSVSLPAS